MAVGSHPLIAFIHIPKTGGSSVNNYLNFNTPHGISHFEHSENNDVENLNWISGHVNRVMFLKRLNSSQRKIDFYSAVREPILHIASMLNWNFEIFARGYNFFSNHPVTSDRNLILEVCACDFSNIYSIMNLLNRYPDNFFGVQAASLKGPADSNLESDDELEDMVASFKFIAHEENISELYEAFGFIPLPGKATSKRVNASKYHFDPKILRQGVLYEFIMDRNKMDQRTYEFVKKHFQNCSIINPLRPSQPLVNKINFREAEYLKGNPDVEIAVKNLAFESGYQHYLKFGHMEPRRMLFTFP